MKVILFLNLFIAFLLYATVIKGKKPFTVNDLHAMRRVSPGATFGNKYIYSVRRWNSKSGKTTTQLRLIPDLNNKGFVIDITNPSEGVSDFNPVWLNENTVGFLSSRNGKNVNFYTVNINSQIVNQVTNYPVDISNLKLAPNKRFIVFSAEVYLDCPDFECTARRNAEVKSRGVNSWRKFTKLMMRHWDKWLTEGKNSHLFHQSISINSQNNVSPIGNPIDIMMGMNVNSPVGPFGGSEEFDISPNSNEIVFTGEINDKDQAWNTGWKIFISPITSRPVKPYMINYTQARIQDPIYSPDGKFIAFSAMDRKGLESDRLHINLFVRDSREIIPLSDKFDYSIIEKTFTKDSKYIVFTATFSGYNKVFMIELLSKKVSFLVENYKNFGLAKTDFTSSQCGSNSNNFLLIRERYNAPADVWILGINLPNKSKTCLDQLTFENKELIDQIHFPYYEQYFFENNGSMVQGWVIFPYSYKPGESKKYPVAHLIHGGPEGAWEEDFHYRWNPMLWAGRDFATILINPHGSSGLGQKYCDAVRNDWGGLPFRDLMKGVDVAVEKYKFMDKNRIGACGASYGGYMINWIQGNTDKYKCLLCHDGVFDTMSMFYSTEEVWFPLAEYGGEKMLPPYIDPSGYEKFNPRNHVHKWKTPMMVVHGGMDFRIPLAQGLSAFTALQKKGIPSQFLYFEKEDHFVLRPENSIKWYNEVLSWMDRWLK